MTSSGLDDMRRTFAAFLLLCAVTGTSSLAAQEPDSARAPEPDSIRYELEGLRIEATRPAVVSGGASAVELRLDSAATLPSPTLDEVLDEMPLVRVRRNSRGQVQPSLRGMEERQIAVLVDGVPITIGWDNRTDLSVVPLTAATEIRMVRGLSSVLAGPNALGGVVEVDITGGGFPDDPPRFPVRARAAVDQTGAVATSGEAAHLWREGEGGVWLRYGGGYRHRDGATLSSGLPETAREGDEDLLLNSDLEYGNGYVALRWQAERGGEWLSLSSSGFVAERGVIPELHLLGGPEPAPRFWRIPNHWRSVTALSAGTGWDETPLGRGDLEASFGVDVQHLEIDDYASALYRDSVGGETGNDRTFTARLLADHTLGPGTLRAAATFADTWHEQILSEEPTSTFRQRLWSFGLETEQPLAPGGDRSGFSRPRITAGVSVDGSSTPETGGFPAQPAIQGWGARLAGQVDAAGGDVTLHGGTSRKVRFPALRELFSGALGKFEPNPDLDPITLWVGELAATVRPDPGLEVQGTLFQQRLLGSIVRAVLPDGRFQRQNRGETRASGLEVVGSWSSGPWSAKADLTLQRVRLLDDDGEETGERPEYQPEVVVGVGGTAPLPLQLQARLELELLGEQFGANPETGRFDRLAPTATFEAGLRRRFAGGPGGLPPLTLSLRAENLTDTDVFDQLGLPRPGRTVRLEAELF